MEKEEGKVSIAFVVCAWGARSTVPCIVHISINRSKFFEHYFKMSIAYK